MTTRFADRSAGTSTDLLCQLPSRLNLIGLSSEAIEVLCSTGTFPPRPRWRKPGAASHRVGRPPAEKLLELGGIGAIDHYWRNVSIHALHDPVRWMYHWIGAYHLNDRHPPRHGAL